MRQMIRYKTFLIKTLSSGRFGIEKKLGAAILVMILLQGLVGVVMQRWGPVPEGPRKTEHDALIRRTAEAYMPNGWDWRILKALMHHESSFNPNARSSAGALGLLQVKPATGREMGYQKVELLTARYNAAAGTAYLRKQWDRWTGIADTPPEWIRTRLALAAYNAGPQRARQAWRQAEDPASWDDVAPLLPSSTASYVQRIMEELYPLYRKQHFGYAVGVLPLGLQSSDIFDPAAR